MDRAATRPAIREVAIAKAPPEPEFHEREVADEIRLAAFRQFRQHGVGRLSPVGLSNPRNRLTVALAPDEIRQGLLSVRRQQDARPGDIHAIDIEQVDASGTPVGGLTLVVVH